MSRLFDGVDDAIEVVDSTSLRSPTTEFTLACWVNYAGDGEDYGSLFGKFFSASYPFVSYEISGDRGVGGPRKPIGTMQVSGTTLHETAAGASLPINTWFFVESRWKSGEKMQLRIYNADGSLNTGPLETPTTVTGTIGYNATSFYVGRAGLASGPTTNSRIANIYVHNEKLTDAEIRELMRGGMPRNPSVGFWPLWGLHSPEVDLSGNGNNGTITGAVYADHPPVRRPDNPQRRLARR